jgi:dolichol-phosphate mannosyltransferase
MIKDQELLIVVPTFNEVGNVVKLYNGIRREMSYVSILFVDDNSKDGTRNKIDDLVQNDSNVFVLYRHEKQGLASAYIEGFKWGMSQNYTYFQQMDGDLSHSPKYLDKFKEEMEGADVVIGSRYVHEGGSNWKFSRHLLSYFGSLYARFVLGLSVKDLTGGFNCWRRSVLDAIDLDTIISNGFAFQIEMKYMAKKRGFKLKEIPYFFNERETGFSKMSLKIVIEAFINVLHFKFR